MDSEDRTDSGFTQSSTSAERRVSISPSRSGKGRNQPWRAGRAGFGGGRSRDIEAIRFLNAREDEGISVLHCSPYIQEWMSRERQEEKARTDWR